MTIAYAYLTLDQPTGFFFVYSPVQVRIVAFLDGERQIARLIAVRI